ncbi:hypothetical protein BDV93DRAFT_185057 [Ceratobasidium sp. AG-I]|nr:hypothetical protein BDV93DRAFT_185057 [Ceratobasidium sp. AG-I]
MPVSVYSDDDRTPRAPVFNVPTNKALQRPSIPDVFYSPESARNAVNLPPSLYDQVSVALQFQSFQGCDLILRATKSRPHIDFYVDRETLFAGSLYLKRKLSELGPAIAEIDVISWEDDADTLDAMLRFVYADRPKPVVEDVEHLRALLKAARKYEIEAAKHALGTAVLLDFGKTAPLQAFALACEFGLVDEAAMISKDTLEVDIMMSDNNNDLGRVSLSYYHRLVHLHKKRATQAIEILQLIDPDQPMYEFDPPMCHGCGTNATWWQIFVEYGCIELKRRPVTTTIFSPTFLAKCVRTSRQVCEECVESYMHTHSQRLLRRLKEDIDALPSYIASAGSFLQE